MIDGPDAASERRELWKAAVGLAVASVVLHLLFGMRVVPAILLALGALAFVGAVAFRHFGRDVFLFLMLGALAIGRVVSWLMVSLMYVTGIALSGLVARLFGMNRLERDFARCRGKTTMLVDAPPTTRETFSRQS